MYEGLKDKIKSITETRLPALDLEEVRNIANIKFDLEHFGKFALSVFQKYFVIEDKTETISIFLIRDLYKYIGIDDISELKYSDKTLLDGLGVFAIKLDKENTNPTLEEKLLVAIIDLVYKSIIASNHFNRMLVAFYSEELEDWELAIVTYGVPYFGRKAEKSRTQIKFNVRVMFFNPKEFLKVSINDYYNMSYEIHQFDCWLPKKTYLNKYTSRHMF